MTGASSGLMGIVEAARRRRSGVLTRNAGFDPTYQDSALRAGTMEPDVTTPKELSSNMGRSPSELSAHYAMDTDEEKPFFIEHPAASAFLAGLGGSLSGRPGGGEEAVRNLSEARRQYRQEKEMRLQQVLAEGQRRETMRMEQARHDETVGFRQEDIARQEKHRQEDQARQDAKEQAQRNKPLSVGAEQGIWDPKEGKWIVQPHFRPKTEPAGRANQERDDAEKAMGTITKLRNQSIDWNAEMEGIRVKAEKARGKGKMPWDEEAPDPKTGYGSGLTYRQRYQMLKRKNDAAVSEINRLQGKVGSLTGRGGQAPQKAPATAGGSATAPSGALASALEKEARGDPVTSLTPEERKAIIAYKEQQSAVQPGAASGG